MTPLDRFRAGTVIPAHPLALDADRKLDERRQRALTRYYLEAGAGGIAVAVHTTQFAIHEAQRGLLRPVLELAATTAAEYRSTEDAAADPDHGHARPGAVLVAGACGPTAQAVAEAELAATLGYHAILLAPYRAGALSEDELIARAAAVGEILPVIGFYLQPAVGGRLLSREFWTRMADLPAVIGVKVAPFDRYATVDTVLGVAASQRRDEVALYTGNDDHIVGDLLSPDFVGGLLGQWSVWTRAAVALNRTAQRAKAGDADALRAVLATDVPLTDANGAIFDVAGGFRGCIPGIHEILRRQGLLAGLWCLDKDEVLSPGQLDEIDRVWRMYPELRDDDFVAEHRDRWLA